MSGGTCGACTDPNALACLSTNAAFAVICKAGYSAAFYTVNGSVTGGGTCQACGDFCSKCDSAGPGNCDSGECANGYVVFTGTTYCSACFGGCAACLSSDLNSCTACSDGQLLSGTKCVSCDSSCSKCSGSITNCTACAQGVELVNNACYTVPNGCAGLSSTDPTQCSQCFAGYNINNAKTACTVDTSCNASSTCTTCSDGFYLNNKQCLNCPSINNCLNCNPDSTSQCLTCNTGYYASSGSCTTCSTGCTDCASANFCKVPQSGYYLLLLSSG